MRIVLFALLICLTPTVAQAATQKSYVGKVLVEKNESWLWPFNSFRKGAPYKGHFGWDLIPQDGCGATVGAVGHGRVMEVLHRGWNGGYGKTVLLDHGNGHYSRYAHLQHATVWKGMEVAPGQEIGRAGKTGYVFYPKGVKKTGCHLHLEYFRLK